MPPIRAPEPTRTLFDPFNSSSTGHQRAENRLFGSTSWRESRTHKLAQQFRDSTGGGGGRHLADLVGAGSEQFGKERRKQNGSWEVGAPGLREKGWQDIRSLMGGTKKRKREEVTKFVVGDRKRRRANPKDEIDVPFTNSPFLSRTSSQPPMQTSDPKANMLLELTPNEGPIAPQIFRSLNLYLNGSTLSSGVSDHRLKSLFIQHGGTLSIALGRRTVTHVVLGSPGGGLAGSKIQKEVAKVSGKGVKYVTPNWVVDSVECGKRLSESRYQAVHTAMKGQGSVLEKMGGAEQRKGEHRDANGRL